MPDKGPDTARSIAGILAHRAHVSADRLAYAFLHEGELVGSLTYRGLHDKASTIAAQVRASGTTGPVLLLYPSGLEFIAAFFGCLLAGVIAVPLYPPGRRRQDARIAAIMADAKPTLGLTGSSVLAQVQAFSAQHPAGASLPWLATDTLSPQGADTLPNMPALPTERTAPAYLQYTSGSTSTPKGVVVGHFGLLQTLQDLDRGWRHDADSVMVSWLPLFHDMGLIYGLLQPMHGGFPCYLMDPMSFLQRPVRWLQALSRYKGTHSAAPNFAFDLCVRGIDDAERKTLDLTHWRVALNAAEPVRPGTLADFAQAFGPCGFDPAAFCPGYGLAESSLKVTAVRRGVAPVLLHVRAAALAAGRIEEAREGDTDTDTRTLVGCGVSEIGARIAIVAPATGVECEAGGVGEIWVHSGSVGLGYWQRPAESAQTFGARLAHTGEGPFLRTGDLGFQHRGELFITGRLKDLVIVRGVNHYPQDIELTVERCHPALTAGAGAVFAIDAGGEERLVVVHELSRKALRHVNADADAVVSAIRTAVAQQHDLAVHAVALLRPASIPKTSSGKIQRSGCRSGFESGTLSVVAQWREPPPSAALRSTAGAAPAGSIQQWIVQRIAASAGVAAHSVDVQAPFAMLGIDSLTAVRLSEELGRWLDRPLSPTILFEYPTPAALSRHLVERTAAAGANAQPVRAPSEPIAVVGIACRFPGGPDLQTFWQSLTADTAGVTTRPASRWGPRGAALPPAHFLDSVDRFDADFFGIAPREAERMDPQQRLLLEVAIEALEDAGLADLAGSRTGVFVGISSSDYARLLLDPTAPPDAYAGTGGALSIAANRLSYVLDLRGPSWAVDTACSSSLVAVHQAAQALRLGECDVALVAGVNVMASPELSQALGEAHMLAPDGRCKTFDASADGYGRGEGCGVVVLKRYRDALRDTDRVAALLLGTAVNQDGRSNGLTAPNGLAQQQVIRSALADAGVLPAEVDYVETHGTGTPLGDPIEVAALQAVLSEGRTADAPCWLGSVKTTIGHLEAAAGIAGLVKTVLALEHEELPPHPHLQRPNPLLRLEGTPFSIPTSPQAWRRGARRRIAGVSSFGFGGTNAHALLAEAPAWQPAATSAPVHPGPHLLTLSAHSPAALAEQVQRWTAHLAQPDAPAPADLCHTANVRRMHHRHRVAMVADDVPGLQAQLATCSADPAGHGSAGALAMLFTGQGSQHHGMGAALYHAEPIFRGVVDDCDAMLRGVLTPSLSEVWLGTGGDALLHETAYTQPALYVLEVALAKLWQSWGVEPAALLGHSVGEYAAAAIAGVFSIEDGLTLVAARGRLMQALPRDGLMVALAADQARVLAMMGDDPHPLLSIAAVNGPRNTVISGARAAVEALAERAERAGIGATPLRTSHAFHSPLVEPMLDEFAALVAGLRLHPPGSPLISNLTGDAVGEEITTPAYWRRHVREAVHFSAGVAALERRGCRTFLEVGPAPVLLGMARQTCTAEACAWLPSLRPGVADTRQLLDSLATWHVRGGAVDWRTFHRQRPGRCVRLPSYPFQRQPYWLPDAQPARANLGTLASPDLYRIAWPAASPTQVPAASMSPGGWVIFAAAGGMGDALADALGSMGHRCLRLRPEADRGMPEPQSLRARVETFVREAGVPLCGAVHLHSADLPAEMAAEAVATAQADSLSALALLRVVAGQAGEVPARLWLVTRAAVAADDAPRRLCLAGAALWGLGRGLALEQPRHWGGLVDLDAVPHADDVARLTTELLGADGEPEVAWRAGGRRMARLVRTELPPEAAPALRREGCYLVTGGCGFLGLEVAAWLAGHGATQLVLVGRRPPSPMAQARIEALRAQGADVRSVCADVAEPGDVARLFDVIAGPGMQPLCGIVHAAGVGEPRSLADLDALALSGVLRPKLAGIRLLDEHSAGLPLDFFVGMSSIASVWGGKGLAHYAAANHALDAWAHDRRARGLPACTLNCGPWAGGGMAADAGRLGLRHSGIASLAPGRYLAALSRLLASEQCQAVAAQVDWSVLRPLHEAQGRGRLFDTLGAGSRSAAPAVRPVLGESLRAAGAAERRPMLLRHLRREVAAVLGFPADKVFDSSEGFFQLGMDSLMAVELRNRLAAALGQALPAAMVFDFPTVDALGAALLGLLEQAPQPTPVVPSSTAVPDEPIAIVGIGCRFPGGSDDAATFWRMQCEGQDAIRRVPADRWDADALYDPDAHTPGTAYTRHGGFIDGVDQFDAQYFGISPREAAAMDPQHRLILEVSHAALEDSGHAFHAPAQTPDRTGVFLGLTHSDYAQMLLADGRAGHIGPYHVTGSTPNAAAGRISYALRLKGPSLTVDTACSSSLVAVDLACRSLRSGECDAALAGGVNLILAPTGTLAACQARMLSPDGRCKTFDASADGYGRGEGAGVVVLKRLSDAVACGDRIWAVVLGSAINQDGRSSGFTVPSGPAQQAVIRRALAAAGVPPGEIGYVEAHGTGTALGDPIEAGALGAVFAAGRRDAEPLPVGSVKGNIGHLESAAGIAGLIRAALVVHHGQIPCLPNLKTPNPEIDWRGLGLRAVDRHLAWPGAAAGRRIAGVSSFGVSGTNAHAVLAEPPPLVAQGSSKTPRPVHVLALSARTPQALRQLADGLARHLAAHPDLAVEDVCYTLNGRARHPVRAAWRVSSIADACSRLRACADAAEGGREDDSEPPRIAWVFDDAATLALPCRATHELYLAQPAFREALDHLASAGAASLPRPLLALLTDEHDDARADPRWRTALGFAVQYALVQTWRAWSGAPGVLVARGHGAWAAACASGALDAAEALQQCLARAADTVAADACAARAKVRCLCMAGGNAAALPGPEGLGLFVEMGVEQSPGLDALQTHTPSPGAHWLRASAPQRSAWEGLVAALAALHAAGVEVDLRGLDSGQRRRIVSLPTYPFQRRRYWIDDQPAHETHPRRSAAQHEGHPLLGRRLRSAVAQDTVEYATTLTPSRVPFLGEHRVFGALVLPSSVYMEMALAAAAEALGPGPVSVSGYHICQAGMIDAEHGRELHLVLRPGSAAEPGRAFEVVGTDVQGDDAACTWTRHAHGSVQAGAVPTAAAPSLLAIQARVHKPMDVAAFYTLLRHHGINIGPRFQVVQQLWAQEGEALGDIQLPAELRMPAPVRIDPVVLDACFQLAGAAFASLPGAARPHLQVGIDRLTLLAPCGPRVWAHARLRHPSGSGSDGLVADLQLYSPAGDLVATVDGLQLRPASAADDSDDRGSRLYQVEWPEQPRAARAPAPPVLPALAHLAEALAARHAEWRERPALADYGRASAAIDALCARIAAQALATLGTSTCIDVLDDDTLQQLGIVPRYRRLLERLLDMSKHAAPPGAETPITALRQHLPAAGAAAAELALLERTAPHLTGVLRGVVDPNELLFPGGDLQLLTRLYEDSPLAAMMNALVQRAVTEVVAQWPTGRTLRILEIGAGTGATTAGILPHLPTHGTDYVFTDVDDRFTQAAAQRFTAYPFVRYERLNIEQDPAPQGFATGHFDIVVAANVLHATARLDRSLAHARRLLAPGGLLVLLEGTAPLRLFDLTFGLTEGWWRFADDPTRPAYPLMPVDAWQALLAAQGFEGFCHVASDDPRWPALPSQAVMTARTAAERAQPATPGHWLLYGDRGGVAQRLSERLRAHGESVTLVAPTDPAMATAQACRDEVRRALAHGQPLQAVVHLGGLDSTFTDHSDDAALHAAVQPACRVALGLAQAVVDLGAGRDTRLCLVTRGAVAIDAGDAARLSPTGLVQSPLWGLGKVLTSEHAELPCQLVDLDPLDGHAVDSLFDELRSTDSAEARVALRAGRRHVARLAAARPTGKPVVVRPDRSYLVTGGLGGIGLHIAQWLAAQGARHLILIGRSGLPSPEAAQAVRAMQDLGVHVVTLPVDVSRAEPLAEALHRIAADGPALGGVVHAAGVFADRLFVDQDWARFEQVFAPKVLGAWNLHRLTRDLPLDFFVLCSSAATLFGGAGLANYVAANEFLDALAAYRRGLGLPGLSIAWGPWAGVGMARHVGSTREAEWAALGLHPLTPADALGGFAEVLGGDTAQVAVMRADWARFATHPLGARMSRFVERLTSTTVPPVQARRAPALERLSGMPEGERPQRLLEVVRTQVEAVLGWPAGERVSVRQGFFDLGMDSLQANELRNRLQAQLGCTLPSTLSFRFPTTAALATHLHEQLFGAPPRPDHDGRTNTPSTASPPQAAETAETSLQHELRQLELMLGS